MKDWQYYLGLSCLSILATTGWNMINPGESYLTVFGIFLWGIFLVYAIWRLNKS